MDILSAKSFIESITPDTLILDCRSEQEFCDAHLSGSWFTTADLLEDGVFQSMLSAHNTLLLIGYKDDIERLTLATREAGIEFNVDGIYTEDIADLKLPIDVVVAIDAEELIIEMKYGLPHLIDIRRPETFEKSSVDGAENITADQILANYEVLTQFHQLYLYSADGQLGLWLISFLKTKKINNLYHILGGFKDLMAHEVKLAEKS